MTRPRLPLTPPKTLEEAESEAEILLADTQKIQLDLKTPNKTDKLGARLPYKDYADWRQSAKAALIAKTNHYRFLKRWIKEQRKLMVTTVSQRRDPKIQEVLEVARVIVKVGTEKAWDEIPTSVFLRLRKAVLAIDNENS